MQNNRFLLVALIFTATVNQIHTFERSLFNGSLLEKYRKINDPRKFGLNIKNGIPGNNFMGISKETESNHVRYVLRKNPYSGTFSTKKIFN